MTQEQLVAGTLTALQQLHQAARFRHAPPGNGDQAGGDGADPEDANRGEGRSPESVW